jgi:thiamine-phosphate pyrophosphorylase
MIAPASREPSTRLPLGPECSSVYAIADVATLGPQRVVAAVAAMADAGIQWIQLRAPALADHELHALAAATCRILEGSPVRLWINDRVDLAALLPFAGVHLGQSDLPPRQARAVVGEHVWIGRSTHNSAQLLAADADPRVDAIAVGPVFSTSSKQDAAPVVGLDFLRHARLATRKPLLAIGGITAGRARQVLDAGADYVVVLGAVCVGDIGLNCGRLLAATRQ